MPKEGPSKKEWTSRLRAYAEREFVFEKGQHPSKTTFWGKEKIKVDRCPLFGSGSGTGKDLFGRVLSCSCTYHGHKTGVVSNYKYRCISRVYLCKLGL